MKVKDFITQEIDIDVYDDVCEELGIAFCGPLSLTEEGARHFSDVLEYEVGIYVNDDGSPAYAEVQVNAIAGAIWKERLRKAKEFFEAAAGYCSVEQYDLWFKEESA